MILGLHGRHGSGKDTYCDLLRQAINETETSFHEVRRVSFADKLKRSAAALLGIDPDALESWKTDENVRLVIQHKHDTSYAIREFTFREYLQRYGTEAHREIFADSFWVDQALPLDGKYDPRVLYVVTDVRFPNERVRVNELNGIMMKLERRYEISDPHPSEQPLQCELVLPDGTLESYAQHARSLVVNLGR